MIDNLKISYELGRDTSVTLSKNTCYDDNLPHNLAAVFAKVIKISSVGRISRTYCRKELMNE